MRKKTLVFAILSGVCVAGMVGYLVLSTVSDGSALEYFKHVDDVLAKPAEWKGRRLRLHGNVVAGTIQKKRGSLDYRFAMFHGDRWLEVTYRGLVPDTFKDCAEVVVKGQLAGAESFQATEITAKCPSKYDATQHAAGCGEKLRPLVLATRDAPVGS